MTANTLRRAATLIRERAEAATATSWSYLGSSTSTEEFGHQAGSSATYLNDDEDSMIFSVESGAFGRQALADAEHIASWHPAAALAVADLLDRQAGFIERGGDFSDIEAGGDASCLAVARAYLGEES